MCLNPPQYYRDRVQTRSRRDHCTTLSTVQHHGWTVLPNPSVDAHDNSPPPPYSVVSPQSELASSSEPEVQNPQAQEASSAPSNNAGGMVSLPIYLSQFY
jgi:hypothetical protein